MSEGPFDDVFCCTGLRCKKSVEVIPLDTLCREDTDFFAPPTGNSRCLGERLAHKVGRFSGGGEAVQVFAVSLFQVELKSNGVRLATSPRIAGPAMSAGFFSSRPYRF